MGFALRKGVLYVGFMRYAYLPCFKAVNRRMASFHPEISLLLGVINLYPLNQIPVHHDSTASIFSPLLYITSMSSQQCSRDKFRYRNQTLFLSKESKVFRPYRQFLRPFPT